MRGRREEELPSHPSAENGVGTAIRAWRRFRGLTLTNLAVQAGFGKNGRGYISRIEHGQIRRLGDERLRRIAAALQVQSADLILARLPEVREDVQVHTLDDAIIGGKALLKKCRERSFDWARIQLLLAKLYYELARASSTALARHGALVEAQRCIESAFLVFHANTTPQSFQEATRLGLEIAADLEATIIAGSSALLKRCLPESLDWARLQFLLAKFYREQAGASHDPVARTALVKAQHSVEAALAVFTQRQVQPNVKEAQKLHQEITHALKQMGEL